MDNRPRARKTFKSGGTNSLSGSHSIGHSGGSGGGHGGGFSHSGGGFSGGSGGYGGGTRSGGGGMLKIIIAIIVILAMGGGGVSLGGLGNLFGGQSQTTQQYYDNTHLRPATGGTRRPTPDSSIARFHLKPGTSS